MSRRVARARDGTFRLRLPEEERALLRRLPGELRDVLMDAGSDGDPTLQRLFPPAYGGGDAERNAEYARLMRGDLVQQRLDGLAALEEAASADRVDAEQLERCLGALNDLRLVLGTRLDVSEDMDWGALSPEQPDFGAYVVYDYLTALQGAVLEALTGDDTW